MLSRSSAEFSQLANLVNQFKTKVIYMKTNILLWVMVAISIAGCAQGKWINNRNSAANYAQDNASCENEAMTVVAPAPPKLVANQPVPPPNYSTNCYRYGNSTECTSRAVQPSRGKFNAFMDGFNQGQAGAGGSREFDRYTKNCMTQKGWSSDIVRTD